MPPRTPKVLRVSPAIQKRVHREPENRVPKPPPAQDEEQQQEGDSKPDKQPRRNAMLARGGLAEPLLIPGFSARLFRRVLHLVGATLARPTAADDTEGDASVAPTNC